jgi:hypothetical protein
MCEGKMGKKDRNSNSENGQEDDLNGRKLTKHHIVPRSRGGIGKTENTVMLPERYHVAWHIFFGNLKFEEAIIFMETVFLSKNEKGQHHEWTMEALYNLQLKIQEPKKSEGKKKSKNKKKTRRKKEQKKEKNNKKRGKKGHHSKKRS